ncbi:MAG: nitrite/sulfite reductase [Polyangiaceae bacterium]
MTDAPFLPKFSKPSDIDEFVSMLEKFEKGELTNEAFRAFRLTRGVYGQRQDGVQMLRVKVPMGLLGKEQLDAFAEVADTYAHGIGHITTRQNLQFHFMKMDDAEAAMRICDQAGLTTREACGNSVRNVIACENAEICDGAPFDVSPYAEALVRYFLRHPLAATLPRKFKVAFSGCPDDCARGAINDIGFVAQVKDGEIGFKVLCAGGLSSSPQAAIVLHDFVPAADVARVGESILRLFDALGNRTNRERARLKYVLRKLGEEQFRAKYAEIRAQVDAEAKADLLPVDSPKRTPAPAVEGERGPNERGPGYLPWRADAVVDQKQKGYVAVHIRLVLGDLTSAQMRGIGDLLSKYGDGSARITVDQNILIPWVDVRSLPAIHKDLAALDLVKLGRATASDVTSCPGASSCNLAITSSKTLATAITDRLEKDDAKSLSATATASIKISGCSHSCGQHHVADIGWHGAAKHAFGKEGPSVPVYQLHLGGGVDARGARFGRQVVKITAKRVPDAVVALLKLFDAEKIEGQSVAQFFETIDPKKVVAALGESTRPYEPGDETDIGQTTGFLVETRDGECAA